MILCNKYDKLSCVYCSTTKRIQYYIEVYTVGRRKKSNFDLRKGVLEKN